MLVYFKSVFRLGTFPHRHVITDTDKQHQRTRQLVDVATGPLVADVRRARSADRRDRDVFRMKVKQAQGHQALREGRRRCSRGIRRQLDWPVCQIHSGPQSGPGHLRGGRGTGENQSAHDSDGREKVTRRGRHLQPSHEQGLSDVARGGAIIARACNQWVA